MLNENEVAVVESVRANASWELAEAIAEVLADLGYGQDMIWGYKASRQRMLGGLDASLADPIVDALCRVPSAVAAA